MTAENEYTDAAGVRYVAETSEARLCIGCAFYPLPVACPKDAPHCSHTTRGDGRAVIWVKAEADGRQA